MMRGEYDGLAVRLKDQEGDGLSGGFDAFLKRKAFKPLTGRLAEEHHFRLLPLNPLIELAVPEADPETERRDFPGSSRVVVN